jgi:membrane associated rhomboid family serine protease
MQSADLPPSPVTKGLIFACFGVFAVQAVGGERWDFLLAHWFGLIPARLSGVWPDWAVGSFLARWSTLITSTFLHGGVFHIAANMMFLWAVGRPVEWVLGSGRFVIVYLISAVAGGLAQLWSEPASDIPVVGASGAISGVFAAYAVMFSRTQYQETTILGLRLPPGLVRVLVFAAGWTVLQLVLGMLLNTGPYGGVAVWAHIGGFMGGLGALFLLRASQREVR